MRLRRRVVITVVITTAALSTMIAIGFLSGWLTLTDRSRPVGRLRPSDLARVIPSEPVPATTVRTGVQTTTTTPAKTPSGGTSTRLGAVTSRPPVTVLNRKENDHKSKGDRGTKQDAKDD
jgi:hypothetical protein